MAENFTQVRRVLKPGGVGVEQAAKLAAALRQCVQRQAEWRDSRYILRVTPRVEEDDRSFLIRHEPALPAPLPRLETQEPGLISSEVLEASYHVLAAYREAHTGTNPLIHGGFCPNCLLLDSYGQWKVTDFGIARAFAETLGAEKFKQLALRAGAEEGVTGEWEWIDETRTDEPHRIAPYVSPEQWQDTQSLFNVETDLFAVGVFLYEQCSGLHPFCFEADRADYYQWVYMWSNGYTPLERARAEWKKLLERRNQSPGTLSPNERRAIALIELVNRMVDRQPESRILTAGEALDNLLKVDSELQDRLTRRDQDREKIIVTVRRMEDFLERGEFQAAQTLLDEVPKVFVNPLLAERIRRIQISLDQYESRTLQDQQWAADLRTQLDQALARRENGVVEKVAREILALPYAGGPQHRAAEEVLTRLPELRKSWDLEDQNRQTLEKAWEFFKAGDLEQALYLVSEVQSWLDRADTAPDLKARGQELSLSINLRLQVHEGLERARNALQEGDLEKAVAHGVAVLSNKSHTDRDREEVDRIFAEAKRMRDDRAKIDDLLGQAEQAYKIGNEADLKEAERCAKLALESPNLAPSQAKLGREYLDLVSQRREELLRQAHRRRQQAEADLNKARELLNAHEFLEARKIAESLTRFEDETIRRTAHDRLAVIDHELKQYQAGLDEQLTVAEAHLTQKRFAQALTLAGPISVDKCAEDALRTRALRVIASAEQGELTAKGVRELAGKQCREAQDCLRTGDLEGARRNAHGVLENQFAQETLRAEATRVLEVVDRLADAQRLMEEGEFPQAIRILEDLVRAAPPNSPLFDAGTVLHEQARKRHRELLAKNIQSDLALLAKQGATAVSADPDISEAVPRWVKANLGELRTFMNNCREDLPPRPATPSLNRNQILGQKYEILECLGMGGMGEIYLARDVVLERRVVLKLAQGVADTGPLVEALRNEARAMAALNHPHIIHINAFDIHGGRPCFETNYIRGQNLAEYARDRKLSGEEAAKILIPLVEAMAYAHRQGILHRDVKPQNIYIGEDSGEGPWLIDFGLAKMRSIYDKRSNAGLCGTPGYLAPEVISSAGITVDHRADIFALGCVLYWLLAREAPFFQSRVSTGDRKVTVPQVLLNTIQAKKNPLDLAAPEAPLALRRICEKALRPDPAERYQDASEFAAELKQFLTEHDHLQAELSLSRAKTRFEKRRQRELGELEDLEAAQKEVKTAQLLGTDPVKEKAIKLIEQIRQVQLQIRQSQKEATKQFDATQEAVKAGRFRTAFRAARQVLGNPYVPDLHPEAQRILDQARREVQKTRKRRAKIMGAVLTLVVVTWLVWPKASAPHILREPDNVTAFAGGVATLEVQAQGKPYPTYRWQKQISESEWDNVSNVTSETDGPILTLKSVMKEKDQGFYRCIVCNKVGTRPSNSAFLKVRSRPIVGFAVTSHTATDQDNFIQIPIRLKIPPEEGPLPSESSILVTVDPQSSAKSKEHYDNLSSQINFPSDTKSGVLSLPVSIIKNKNIEGDKRLVLRLNPPQQSDFFTVDKDNNTYTLTIPYKKEVKIAPPVKPKVSFARSDPVTVKTDNQTRTLTIPLLLKTDSGPIEKPITLLVETDKGTTAQKSDYTLETKPITFPAKSPDNATQELKLTILPNKNVGDDKTLVLKLKPDPPASATVSGTCTITLINSNNAIVEFGKKVPRSDNEYQIPVHLKIPSGGGLLKPVRISVVPLDNSTLSKNEYELKQTPFDFLGDNSTKTVTLTITKPQSEPKTVYLTLKTDNERLITVDPHSLTVPIDADETPETLDLRKPKIVKNLYDKLFKDCQPPPPQDWKDYVQSLIVSKDYSQRLIDLKFGKVKDKERLTVTLTYPWENSTFRDDLKKYDNIPIPKLTGTKEQHEDNITSLILEKINEKNLNKYLLAWAQRDKLEKDIINEKWSIDNNTTCWNFLKRIAEVKLCEPDNQIKSLKDRIQQIRESIHEQVKFKNDNFTLQPNRFIEYFWGPKYVHAFVVGVNSPDNKTSSCYVRVGETSHIKNLIKDLFSDNGNNNSPTDQTNKVGNILLKNIVELHFDETPFINLTEGKFGVVIAPDGPLCFVPFYQIPFDNVTGKLDFKVNGLGDNLSDSNLKSPLSCLADTCIDKYLWCPSGLWTFSTIGPAQKETGTTLLDKWNVLWKFLMGFDTILQSPPYKPGNEKTALLLCTFTNQSKIDGLLDNASLELINVLKSYLSKDLRTVNTLLPEKPEKPDAGYLVPRLTASGVQQRDINDKWFIPVSNVTGK